MVGGISDLVLKIGGGGFNSGFWTEKDGEDVGFSSNWQQSGIWGLWD